MKRVAVTGYGLVSALGRRVPDAFARLRDLRNAVLYSEDLAGYKGLRSYLCAPIPDYTLPPHFTRKVIRSMGRVAILALDATEQALAQAGLLDDPVLKGGRTGVAYGSSFGSMDAITDFYSILQEHSLASMTSTTYLKIMPQTTAVNLSVHFGTTGRLLPSGTACTSGSIAIGEAYEAIKFGLQDVMIAGGAEEFSPANVAVFDTLFATSRQNDCPERTPRAFDKARDGLVIGEGAATMVLEERDHALARGAEILAEVVGFGTNTDGRHITQPSIETQAVAMRLALQDAGLQPGDVGYVNAHGTATEQGDIVEGTATASVYGTHVPVSTIKNYTGHTLGACGALEAILTVEMMRHRWFAPNLNLETPDERCGGLDFIQGSGRELDVRVAASNNFAFGGINTSLLFALP